MSQDFITRSEFNSLKQNINTLITTLGSQNERMNNQEVNVNELVNAIKNPMIENLNAGNFNIENVKDFSALSGKFTTLKVGDDVITRGGGSSTFIGLTDTPTGFRPDDAGKAVKVNAAGNSLEFVDSTSITTFTDLTDTPLEITLAHADKVVKVNSAGDALEFVDSISGTFSELTDTPPLNGLSDAGKFVKVDASGEGLEFVAAPDLVVMKRPHSDQVATQLGIVEEDTPFYWRSGGNNTLIGNWGSTSLLPAIGTTISKGTTNSFTGQPLNEQAEFTFNRAVTAYLGIRVNTEQSATYDVDLNGWTLVFEEGAGGDRIFKNWGNDLERLFFKIFPAGTYTLDDSFAHYFFKPFPA